MAIVIDKLLGEARKIVLKFGSSTLTGGGTTLDGGKIASFARSIAGFREAGKSVVIVSSGAQAAGRAAVRKWENKRDIHYKQALCAVGQVELMQAWRLSFARHGLQIAQILLTRDDFSCANRTLNMRNTIFTLVDEGIIPIINENDTVSVEEIKIGDNDNLASQSAALWGADLLILFSDIDGVYTKNPNENADALFIPEVSSIEQLRKTAALGGAGALGTGGIATKVEAAEHALLYGIPTVITLGNPDALDNLLKGSQRGTLFYKVP